MVGSTAHSHNDIFLAGFRLKHVCLPEFSAAAVRSRLHHVWVVVEGKKKMKWRKAQKKPVIVEFRDVKGDHEFIRTLEGDLTAKKGRDYIIRGVNREIYPIRKDIFEQTYDVIE